MTAKKKPATDNPDSLRVDTKPGTTSERRLAEVALDPAAHGMATAQDFTKNAFGKQSVTDTYQIVQEAIAAAEKGDHSRQRAMLAGQSIALNTIFTEMARRAACNMGEHLKATELYMRLAFKAQAQCRATVEALDRLTNGHVQTVKHVHVAEGGQAVIADQFHNHDGGLKNGQIAEQPHGTGPVGTSPALYGPDPFGSGVPISGDQGQEAMPVARGAVTGRA